jgi:hypothetical protein
MQKVDSRTSLEARVDLKLWATVEPVPNRRVRNGTGGWHLVFPA